MLKVESIKNVNNTPNRAVNFKGGLQTNYGISAPSPSNNMVEGGLLTGFFGTISPLLSKLNSRAQSIESGLKDAKVNYFA